MTAPRTDVRRRRGVPPPAMVLLLATALWLGGHAAGRMLQEVQEQSPPPPVAGEAAGGESASQVDADALRRQIETLSAVEQRTPDQEQFLTLLQSALELVGEAQRERAEVARLTEATRTAPEMLAAVNAQLENPPAREEVAVDPDASLESVTAELETARTELRDARSEVAELEAGSTARSERRRTNPDLVAATAARIEELRDAIRQSGPPDSADPLAEAQHTSQLAELEMLLARQERLASELQSFDASRELMRAKRQLAERRVLIAERAVETWDDIVSTRRTEAAEIAAAAAAAAQVEAASAHPVVGEIATENQEYAQERAEVAGDLDLVRSRMKQTDGLLTAWREQYDVIADQVSKVGNVNAVGVRLRDVQGELPTLREYRISLRKARDAAAEAQIATIDLERVQLDLVDLEAATDERMASAAAIEKIPPAQAEKIRAAARDALVQQQQYVDDLISIYDEYEDALFESQRLDGELITLVEDVREFIGERILWIRSNQPFGPRQVGSLAAAARYVSDPQNWSLVVHALWEDLNRSPVPLVGGLALWALLLVMRRRIWRRIVADGRDTRIPSRDRFGLTLDALAMTVVLASTWSIPMVVIAWRLRASPVQTDFTDAVAAALNRTAFLLFALLLLRLLCKKDGLGDAHLRWKERHRALVRRQIGWLATVALPLAFVALILTNQSNRAHEGSLARVLYLAGLLALALVLQRLFQPSTGIMAQLIERRRGGWLDRLRYVWSSCMVATPLLLAAAASMGYLYTATELGRRFVNSALLIIGWVIARDLLLRWLALAQRRLAIAKARQQLETKAQAEGDEPTESAISLEEIEVDVDAVSAQTRRLLRALMAIVCVAGLLWIWAGVLPALAGLENVTIGQGEHGPITLANLLWALVALGLTFFVGTNIPGMLEITILQRLPISPSSRYATTTVVRYAIIIIGIIIAFTALGIGWSKVQWLAAAVSVGLGFGLQEIFANFVSGLIILFEQPIRVGDTVTIGQTSGTVSRIQIRATTITDWDRKELIIPNREFVTGQVVNWTLSDAMLRLRVEIGVAYGSDTDLVRRLLLECARANDRVLREPPPDALFLEFGESALQFELRVFLPHVDQLLAARHELHRSIDATFRAAGVEIAFPQHDVHIRSDDERPAPAAEPPAS